MTINRKDTILIAVLMNIGLLTVLFITAISFEEDTLAPQAEPQSHIAEAPVVETPAEYLKLVSSQDLPNDEVDRVLQAYVEQKKPETKKELASQATTPVSKKTNPKYVEITVKRGDSLDRIARANKTSIREIKKLNELKTDRLRIGQVLKIPLPDSTASKAKKAPKPSPGDSPVGAVYYELKSGDNPWKVAKNFNVSYESIIKLNDLDEDKAKSLKPGDKIRIK